MRQRKTIFLLIPLAVLLCAFPRPAAAGCPEVLAFLNNQGIATGATCFHADDLRVPQPPTPPVTPPDNSITTFADGTALPGLLAGFGSFTPVTDLGVISTGPTPTSTAVPGIQVEGWYADDPAGEARFLLRFPDNWNGKLVVAGASGTRSEFNGDWAWSDYVLPKGYAYASANKGVLNLFLVSLALATQPASDSYSCRTNPAEATPIWVHFYDNDVLVADYPGVGQDRLKPFTQWTRYMIETAIVAQRALDINYHHAPYRTYAVGTSNGGYQVRRVLEGAPELFDGGVDWEGTFVDPRGPNVLTDLPPAIKNFPGYVAAGCNPASPEAHAIRAAGYPPDIVTTCTADASTTDGSFGTLWGHYSAQFWEVTACQWQKRFDPSYDTYVAGLGNYDYRARIRTVPGVFSSVDEIETSGDIGKPLITVAGTMDALLPIKREARRYEALVLASWRHPAYRLYEVQNGNHIEGYIPLFPNQLELIQPHAQKAFDLLVDYVEHHQTLPPSQCIPKGGAISQHPSEPGHCAHLFVP
jgi:3HB-oligomer hydrolase (3HBOH)